jgi:hypothetical protein
LIAHALEITQDDCLFEFGRQPPQAFHENLRGLGAFDRPVRRGSLFVSELQCLQFATATILLEAARLPEVVDHQVASDSHDPVLETAGLSPECAEVSIHPEKDLLGQILRLIPPADIAISHSANSSAV